MLCDYWGKHPLWSVIFCLLIEFLFRGLDLGLSTWQVLHERLVNNGMASLW